VIEKLRAMRDFQQEAATDKKKQGPTALKLAMKPATQAALRKRGVVSDGFLVLCSLFFSFVLLFVGEVFSLISRIFTNKQTAPPPLDHLRHVLDSLNNPQYSPLHTLPLYFTSCHPFFFLFFFFFYFSSSGVGQ
jgi:hypothetical protein